ncbi:hypothetical protein NQ314_003113 [Rhamnusium bicolor]|uniref:Uncharacterized protein n=1 Tax=Rhamnusium bicolor TaxID=1586634 RepID=A0AAV8ZQJ1_9CUCU|nr:hypothetical protein NQ314_003113 [Rhamnusium bicolor]
MLQGHKKGHSIKGFKSSHSKDESGKTEEFYDEDHDEGGNYGFDGHFGKFGEGGASSFKGGHEDGKFNAEEAKKSGHYDNEYLLDKAHANHGKFGENKYAGNEEYYGANKGIDEHDLTGHHESSNYFKHYPIHY